MSYHIQQVAQKLNLSTYTIRYYHDNGMLPFVKRDAHNNRIFSDQDLEWLRLIVCLRKTGMPVERVQHYLDLVQQGDATILERYQMMQDQQKRATQELATMQRHLTLINHKVAHYHAALAHKTPKPLSPADHPTPTHEMA